MLVDANFIDSGEDQSSKTPRQPPTCGTAPSRTRRLEKVLNDTGIAATRASLDSLSRQLPADYIAFQVQRQRTASFSGLRINLSNLMRHLEFPFVLPVALLATFFPIINTSFRIMNPTGRETRTTNEQIHL